MSSIEIKDSLRDLTHLGEGSKYGVFSSVNPVGRALRFQVLLRKGVCMWGRDACAYLNIKGHFVNLFVLNYFMDKLDKANLFPS